MCQSQGCIRTAGVLCSLCFLNSRTYASGTDERNMGDMKKKTLSASVNANEGGRIVAKLTTDSVDRDGEVLIPQGMNAKDYENNPVLFYNHDYANPIGTVANLKRKDNAVVGELRFAQRPEDYKGDFFPTFVETLIRQGIVKGISVGFVPEEGGARHATKADKSKFGTGIKKVFNKWKLLEVSVAPLPANQDALVQAVDKGLVTSVQVKKFCHIELPERPSTVTIKRTHKIKLRSQSYGDQMETAVNRAIRKRMGRLYE